jgi:hypothetical protein
MEAQISESAVFPSQSYAASFFTKFPTDSRFLKVTPQRFMPVRIIDGKDIEFTLDRYTAGNVILIQDTILNVRFQILKSDGVTLPDTQKFVAPRNNILHTLFSSVALHINNVQISTAPDNYCYKAYITNLLSYPGYAKSTHLQLQGYADDTPNFFDSAESRNNFGFGIRNDMFRKNFDDNLAYRPEGAQFCGRLYHELSSCETGLPPNTKVSFVLTKNKDEFILQSDKEDTEQYKVKITNIFLTVPIAELSQNVYNELSYLMSKKEDTTPVTIQFRKFEVMPMSVPKFKQDYQTGDLFTDGDLPCRIVIAFVDAKARLGSYHQNPFDFKRKWVLPSPSASAPGPPSFEERINLLEDVIKMLTRSQPQSLSQNEQALIQDAIATRSAASAASAPSSSRVETRSSAAAAAASSAQASDRSEIQEVRQPVTSLSTDDIENFENRVNLAVTKKLEQILPPFYQKMFLKKRGTEVEDTKSYVWISNIKVTLNNNLIDQIDDSQSEDECLNSYYRLCQTTGVLNTPFSNGIGYEAFR